MMIFRWMKLKNGSTLMMVLIVMAILSLLGITIISLSVTNYKMKSIDHKAKVAFYLAEAGLEEAYGIMIREIDRAIEHGRDFSENRERWDRTNNQPPSTAELETWFKEDYMRYLRNNMVNVVTNSEYYKAVDQGFSNVKPDVKLGATGFVWTVADGKYYITLESTYTYEKVNATVQGKYQIAVPSYPQISNPIELIKKVNWRKLR